MTILIIQTYVIHFVTLIGTILALSMAGTFVIDQIVFIHKQLANFLLKKGL